MAVGDRDPRGGSHGHAVLFYRTGGEYAGQVAAHLGEALRTGGVAIAIATPAHRAAIAAELGRAGADVAAAEATGRYVALDAVETMNRFMVADWPNAASFWLAVSALLGPACEAGQPVHVFGEVVALLWDFGQVAAAIELEAMWNEIGGQYAFSALCAYPAGSVSGGQHQDSLAELCRMHTAVVGGVPGRA